MQGHFPRVKEKIDVEMGGEQTMSRRTVRNVMHVSIINVYKELSKFSLVINEHEIHIGR